MGLRTANAMKIPSIGRADTGNKATHSWGYDPVCQALQDARRERREETRDEVGKSKRSERRSLLTRR